MKTAEKALQFINNVKDAKFLEVACGCAELSIEAAKYANSVDCIDLDEFRLKQEINNYNNIHFQKMDATQMNFNNEYFDIVALYNAVMHLEEILESVIKECIRVTKKSGEIYVISTFRMDKPVMQTKLHNILVKNNIQFQTFEEGKYSGIVIHGN